jgi:hypothetical protein
VHRKVSKTIKQCKNISERIVAICNIACYIYSNGQGVPDNYGGLLLDIKTRNLHIERYEQKVPFKKLGLNLGIPEG